MTGMATVIFGEALVDEFPTEQVIGGAPFNVARHLAAFMAPPLMITRIGDDRNGQAVRAEFERFVMPETGLQIDPIEETGRVVVERDAQGKPEGHRFIILPQGDGLFGAHEFGKPRLRLRNIECRLHAAVLTCKRG